METGATVIDDRTMQIPRGPGGTKFYTLDRPVPSDRPGHGRPCQAWIKSPAFDGSVISGDNMSPIDPRRPSRPRCPQARQAAPILDAAAPPTPGTPTSD